MKKILLIIVIACVGFLSSCKRDERELKSLAGTTWRCDFDVDEVFELNFESGIVKLIYTIDCYIIISYINLKEGPNTL